MSELTVHTGKHLHFLYVISEKTVKWNELSSSKQKLAMDLEKMGLVLTEPLRDEITELTANWTHITEEGRKALQTCIDQLQIYAESLKK